MPGFSTRDQIINAISVGGRQDMWNFHKVSTGANMFYWFSTQAIGGTPGTTTLAGGVASTAPTNTAASVVPGTMFFSDVSPTYSRYLLSAGILGATATGTAMIYDRLFISQAITLAAAANVNISTAASVTRYTGASTSATAGLNEIWIELSVASTTAGAFTVTYVDGAGVPQTTPSQSLPTTSIVANGMFRVQLLATASPGVRSVTSINVTTAITGSTSANILIVRPLTYINFGSGLWNEVSFLDDVMGLPRIYNGAALCIATITPVTTQIWGNINTVYN